MQSGHPSTAAARHSLALPPYAPSVPHISRYTLPQYLSMVNPLAILNRSTSVPHILPPYAPSVPGARREIGYRRG
eukprot:585384-Rhodomonas_salina.2